MLLAFLSIISCSLDTFKSENLASWSINLDLPLYKTDYTIAEMLKDYDELGVELYDNGPDSIYVFNNVTPYPIDVGFVIIKDGDDILPETIPVNPYDIEVATLPEELDGINFVDVDLFLEVDLDQFDISLADSIIIDQIILTGTNDEGEVETATITNQDILLIGSVEVDDPEDLINMRPKRVTIEGQITVYPSEVAGGQISDQTIYLISKLHAPLELEITETSTFDNNPEKIGLDVDDQLFETFTLFAEIDNQMEIGGDLQFLVSPDTMNFEPNSIIKPDTLFSLTLLPNHAQMETIELGSEKFDLLADSTYMKAFFNFVGMTDAQGNTTPSRFFTEDSIKVLLYGSAELLIDPQNMGEEE